MTHRRYPHTTPVCSPDYLHQKRRHSATDVPYRRRQGLHTTYRTSVRWPLAVHIAGTLELATTCSSFQTTTNTTSQSWSISPHSESGLSDTTPPPPKSSSCPLLSFAPLGESSLTSLITCETRHLPLQMFPQQTVQCYRIPCRSHKAEQSLVPTHADKQLLL
jgi:hypothetical protein